MIKQATVIKILGAADPSTGKTRVCNFACHILKVAALKFAMYDHQPPMSLYCLLYCRHMPWISTCPCASMLMVPMHPEQCSCVQIFDEQTQEAKPRPENRQAKRMRQAYVLLHPDEACSKFGTSVAGSRTQWLASIGAD